MKPNARNLIYCPQCKRSKQRFESKKEADMFIKYNAEECRQENGYAPIRAYYCQACCGWHLSSRAKLYPTKPSMKKKIVRLYAKRDELIPKYETELASGFDLKADIEESFELKPLERRLVHTGLFIELPIGQEAQVRPRSGNAFKLGLSVLNTPGTIDADYRGEIGVVLVNLSNEPITIKPLMKIAQCVVAPVTRAEFEIVSSVTELSSTVRAEGGFGHTDNKK